jgi:PAS domain S-box-containing protein
MTIVVDHHLTSSIQTLSAALVATPPATPADLAELLARHLGGSVILWERKDGNYEAVCAAGERLPDTPAALPATLPAPRAPYVYADTGSFPWGPAAILPVDERWRVLLTPLPNSASLPVVHALVAGWLGCLSAPSRAAILANEDALADGRMLQAIIDATPEGIVVGLAPDGHLVLANAMAEQLWGHPLLNVTVDDYHQYGLFLPNGEPLPPEQTGIATVLRTGEPLLAHELLLRRPDGISIPVLTNTSPIKAADGSMVGAVAIFQDISAWKQQEQDRDDAIAAIAHDLKNPLTTIRGSADLLLRRALKEDRPERETGRLKTIIAQVDRMGDFLGLLVDVGRLYSGELPLAREQTQLDALILEVVTAMNSATQNPRIVFQADPAPPLKIDPIWMERVVRNLLDNALKYSPFDSPVTVMLAATSAELTISVGDSGIGIDPGDVERIFERFTRGRNSVGRIAGTGLGLYTVRAVVQAHGGIIRAESDGPGRGSRFILSLPIQQDDAPPASKGDTQ